jgi:PhnB protein
MAAIDSYLIFPGTCEEAVKFYTKIFDGQVQYTMRYKEAPMDCPPDWKEKVIHTNFMIRGVQLMASDGFPGNMPVTGNNVQLCLNFEKDEKIDDLFKKIAEGGKITMPLNKTFWGAYFGQLVDKFGVSWMFNQNLEEKK